MKKKKNILNSAFQIPRYLLGFFYHGDLVPHLDIVSRCEIKLAPPKGLG